MYIDNFAYFMKIGGTAAGGAWTTKWAIAANTFDQIDLTTVTNRLILDGGYCVWRVGTVPIQAHAGTTTFDFGCAATAVYPTTMFWQIAAQDHAVHEAWVTNTIVYAIKVPAVIPLRYLSVGITPATAAWTAGTLDIFLTPTVQIPYTAIMPGG